MSETAPRPAGPPNFFRHLRPRTYPEAAVAFGRTWHLGYLCMLLLAIETVTGLLLMVYYAPTPERAHASIVLLRTEVPFGALIRNLHRLAGEMLVAAALLHLARVAAVGAYRGQRTPVWFSGLGLLLITLALAFSGYLLPWDQLAFWAVTVGTGMADAVPLAGPQIGSLLRGGPEIGADGLLRFYLLHVGALPALGLVLTLAHYYRVVRLHSQTTQRPGETAQRRVSLFPDLLEREALLALAAVLTLTVLCLTVYDAPLGPHADPRHTPQHTQAPWFFLWVQGLLKLGEAQLTGVAIPFGLLCVLLLVPLLDRSQETSSGKRWFAASLVVLAAVAGGVLTWMGSSHFAMDLPPATAVLARMAPEEGSGPLDAVTAAHLTPGIYPTTAGTKPPDKAVAELHRHFVHAIAQTAQTPHFQAPSGVLVIEDWQAGLQRITFRILWQEIHRDKGSSAERVVYRHRDQRSGWPWQGGQ